MMEMYPLGIPRDSEESDSTIYKTAQKIAKLLQPQGKRRIRVFCRHDRVAQKLLSQKTKWAKYATLHIESQVRPKASASLIFRDTLPTEAARLIDDAWPLVGYVTEGRYVVALSTADILSGKVPEDASAVDLLITYSKELDDDFAGSVEEKLNDAFRLVLGSNEGIPTSLSYVEDKVLNQCALKMEAELQLDNSFKGTVRLQANVPCERFEIEAEMEAGNDDLAQAFYCHLQKCHAVSGLVEKVRTEIKAKGVVFLTGFGAGTDYVARRALRLMAQDFSLLELDQYRRDWKKRVQHLNELKAGSVQGRGIVFEDFFDPASAIWDGSKGKYQRNSSPLASLSEPDVKYLNSLVRNSGTSQLDKILHGATRMAGRTALVFTSQYDDCETLVRALRSDTEGNPYRELRNNLANFVQRLKENEVKLPRYVTSEILRELKDALFAAQSAVGEVRPSWAPALDDEESLNHLATIDGKFRPAVLFRILVFLLENSPHVSPEAAFQTAILKRLDVEIYWKQLHGIPVKQTEL